MKNFHKIFILLGAYIVIGSSAFACTSHPCLDINSANSSEVEKFRARVGVQPSPNFPVVSKSQEAFDRFKNSLATYPTAGRGSLYHEGALACWVRFQGQANANNLANYPVCQAAVASLMSEVGEPVSTSASISHAVKLYRMVKATDYLWFVLTDGSVSPNNNQRRIVVHKIMDWLKYYQTFLNYANSVSYNDAITNFHGSIVSSMILGLILIDQDPNVLTNPDVNNPYRSFALINQALTQSTSSGASSSQDRLIERLANSFRDYFNPGGSTDDPPATYAMYGHATAGVDASVALINNGYPDIISSNMLNYPVFLGHYFYTTSASINSYQQHYLADSRTADQNRRGLPPSILYLINRLHLSNRQEDAKFALNRFIANINMLPNGFNDLHNQMYIKDMNFSADDFIARYWPEQVESSLTNFSVNNSRINSYFSRDNHNTGSNPRGNAYLSLGNGGVFVWGDKFGGNVSVMIDLPDEFADHHIDNGAGLDIRMTDANGTTVIESYAGRGHGVPGNPCGTVCADSDILGNLVYKGNAYAISNYYNPPAGYNYGNSLNQLVQGSLGTILEMHPSTTISNLADNDRKYLFVRSPTPYIVSFSRASSGAGTYTEKFHAGLGLNNSGLGVYTLNDGTRTAKIQYFQPSNANINLGVYSSQIQGLTPVSSGFVNSYPATVNQITTTNFPDAYFGAVRQFSTSPTTMPLATQTTLDVVNNNIVNAFGVQLSWNPFGPDCLSGCKSINIFKKNNMATMSVTVDGKIYSTNGNVASIILSNSHIIGLMLSNASFLTRSDQFNPSNVETIFDSSASGSRFNLVMGKGQGVQITSDAFPVSSAAAPSLNGIRLKLPEEGVLGTAPIQGQQHAVIYNDQPLTSGYNINANELVFGLLPYNFSIIQGSNTYNLTNGQTLSLLSNASVTLQSSGPINTATSTTVLLNIIGFPLSGNASVQIPNIIYPTGTASRLNTNLPFYVVHTANPNGVTNQVTPSPSSGFVLEQYALTCDGSYNNCQTTFVGSETISFN